jgi:N-acyl-D-aspartate/D-glutamate deacylase
MFDLIIHNGTVINGEGTPSVAQDVAISNGKIVGMGQFGDHNASRKINAAGLVIAPGFIDIHSHSDWTLMPYPRAETSLRQGITTEVVGNCGLSFAPVGDKDLLASIIPEFVRDAIELKWSSFGEYLYRLAIQGLAINILHLVGHSALRIAVMGFDPRPPTATELVEMGTLLRESLDHGAGGLSFGLEYPPGNNTVFSEMVALCKVVARRGLFFSIHMRDQDQGYLEAIQEALEVARQSGASLEISHIPPHAGLEANLGEKALELVQEARQEGIDVNFDAHPYLWNQTFMSTFLPPWAFSGGVGKTLERLSDPTSRAQIKQFDNRLFQQLFDANRWDKFVLSQSAAHPDLIGKNFFEIAEIRNTGPEEAVMDLLLEESEALYSAMWLVKGIDETAIPSILRNQNFIFGSDGVALSLEGPLGATRMHPRCWGSTAKFLGDHVRKGKLLSLEEAVHTMTAKPARKIGLTDRGTLGEGMVADIVLFNPETIEDLATYRDPNCHPSGIEYVFLNGEAVLDRGVQTNAMPGRILQSS